MTRLWATTVASIIFLWACAAAYRPPVGDGGTGGSGTGGSGGSGGGSVVLDAGLPFKSACSTLNAKRCDYYARCGLIEDSDSSRRDCVTLLLATWCGPLRWPARVDVGTLTYDPLAAQTCADAWATRACSDWEGLPALCNRLTKPNVAPFQGCYGGFTECTEGVCRGAACPRTCQALGIANDVCQLDTDCKSPLYCKTSVVATGLGTCTALGSSSALCSADEPCATGLACVASHCIAPPAAGAACLSGLCSDTSWCQFTPDGGLCTTRVGVNAPCTDDVQCLPGYLCQFGSCQPKSLPLGRDRECSDRQICPAGTVCVGASSTELGRCTTPLPQGRGCGNTNDCEGHLACGQSDAGVVCGPRQPNLGRCTVDADCQILSRCKQGQCTRLPTTGQSCVDEQVCLVGPCVATDGGAFCGEKFGPGVRCSGDGECASGRCVANACLPSCAP